MNQPGAKEKMVKSKKEYFKTLPEEERLRLNKARSEALKGFKRPPFTEEHKAKIRANVISRNYVGTNNPASGRHWYNNGKVQIFYKGECPEGFTPGINRDLPYIKFEDIGKY